MSIKIKQLLQDATQLQDRVDCLQKALRRGNHDWEIRCVQEGTGCVITAAVTSNYQESLDNLMTDMLEDAKEELAAKQVKIAAVEELLKG